MKRLLSGAFVFVATLFIFFEEWLWFRLLSFMKSVAALPIIRNLENVLRRQNKWVSLAVFIIPELSFIPVKLGVVWLMGNNHAFSGVILFIAAKITGTALFAWMWEVTEAKITQFAWIRWIRDNVAKLRSWAHNWVQQQPAYHRAKEFVAKIKAQKEHWAKRKFRAAIAVAKHK
jgi:hypothetical protein